MAGLSRDEQVTADHLSDLGWSKAKIQTIIGGPEPADDLSSADTSSAAQAEAHLRSLGWSQSDVARLLVGPDKAHLTAESLFRQHAANSVGDQNALVNALSQAGARNIKPDPALLGGLDITHLSPDTPADLDKIISQFAQLPDVQKQRFLLLLGSQKANKKSPGVNPGSAGTGKGTTKTSSSAGDALPVVKSGLDLLSTALKGLLGTGATKKGATGSPKKGQPKNQPVDEPEDSSDDEETPDEGDDSEDRRSEDDTEDSPVTPDDPLDTDSESAPD